MRVLTTVISTKRETPTLSATLSSLSLAGFVDPVVYYDSRARGCYRAYQHAARCVTCRSDFSEYDRILMSEDDVQYTEQLLPGLIAEGAVMSRSGITSLYTAEEGEEKPDWSGWAAIDPEQLPKACRGALAFLWRPAQLVHFLTHLPKVGQWANRTDHAIGLYCHRYQVPLWLHQPSFARHTGVESTLRGDEGGIAKYRQCREFLPRWI